MVDFFAEKSLHYIYYEYKKKYQIAREYLSPIYGDNCGITMAAKIFKLLSIPVANISWVIWPKMEFSSSNVLLATPRTAFETISVVYFPQN